MAMKIKRQGVGNTVATKEYTTHIQVFGMYNAYVYGNHPDFHMQGRAERTTLYSYNPQINIKINVNKWANKYYFVFLLCVGMWWQEVVRCLYLVICVFLLRCLQSNRIRQRQPLYIWESASCQQQPSMNNKFSQLSLFAAIHRSSSKTVEWEASSRRPIRINLCLFTPVETEFGSICISR